MFSREMAAVITDRPRITSVAARMPRSSGGRKDDGARRGQRTRPKAVGAKRIRRADRRTWVKKRHSLQVAPRSHMAAIRMTTEPSRATRRRA
jgi:hypothetical protein